MNLIARLGANNMKKTLYTALLGSILLVGCTPITFGPEDKRIGIAITEESVFFNDLDSVEVRLKNEIFNIDVINVTDERGPSNFANDISDSIIHEYRPERITMGMLPYVKAVLHKKLQFNKKQETEYLAEYTLKNISTKIRTGDWWSGKYGFFESDVELDVIIRDKTSKVLVQKTLNTTSRTERRVAKGRQPSMAMDRKIMLETLNMSLKKIALLSGWELRQKLNGTREYYDPLKKSSIDEVYE